MADAAPHYRHQASLEGILYFSSPKVPLSSAQRDQAKARFYCIVQHFIGHAKNRPYNKAQLIRYTYEYAITEDSRDNILRAFFEFLDVLMEGEIVLDAHELDDLAELFFNFADDLMNFFFLPLKATAHKTPQPSPAFHSAIQRLQKNPETFTGTPDRLSALRGACLIRDHHKCVVSRHFDAKEAELRIRQDGDAARDDEGNLLLADNLLSFGNLEVAHILPHAITETAGPNSELNPAKQTALAILNMFDNGVARLIEGYNNIDRSFNAITLTLQLHIYFGQFKIYFEPVPDQIHTYIIKSHLPVLMTRNLGFPIPVTRTLHLSRTQTIDPPSPRLLAIHRAISHILHLSGAGGYIDQLLRDMDEGCVQADGATELDRLVQLRLGEWLIKRPVAW